MVHGASGAWCKCSYCPYNHMIYADERGVAGRGVDDEEPAQSPGQLGGVSAIATGLNGDGHASRDAEEGGGAMHKGGGDTEGEAGAFVATGSRDKTVRVWCVATAR